MKSKPVFTMWDCSGEAGIYTWDVRGDSSIYFNNHDPFIRSAI